MAAVEVGLELQGGEDPRATRRAVSRTMHFLVTAPGNFDHTELDLATTAILIHNYRQQLGVILDTVLIPERNNLVLDKWGLGEHAYRLPHAV